MNSIVSIIQSVTILIDIYLVFLLLSRKTEGRIKYIFSAMIICTALWSFEIVLINNHFNVDLVNLESFSTTAILVFLLFFFTSYFPQKVKYINNFLLIVSSIPMFIAVGLAQVHAITKVAFFKNDVFIYLPGKYFNIFFLIIIFYIGLSIYNLFYNYYHSEKEGKHQLYILTLGIIATAIPAMITDLILPSFGIFALNNLGPSFSIILDIAVFYAIVKHRFLNVKFIFGSLLYSGVFMSIMSLLISLIIAFEVNVLHVGYPDPSFLAFGIISGIIFSVIVIFIHSKLSLLYRLFMGTDKKNQIIETIRSMILESINLEKSINNILIYLKKALDVSDIYIYTRFENNDYIYCDSKTFYDIIQKDNAQIEEALSSRKSVYITSDEEKNIVFPYKEFKEHNIIFASAINLDNDDKAIFFIQSAGIKDKALDRIEIDFFSGIFKQLALFINRALLHQRVVEFNEHLQEEIKKATDELVLKNKELEMAYSKSDELAKQEGEMLDIIGHEVRTPATVVRMAAYMIQEKPDDVEFRNLMVKRIENNIEKQLRLIETLIDSTKLENNKMKLNLRPVDIDKLLKMSLDDFSFSAQEKNLPLNYYPPGVPLHSLADEVRLREVIDNLISNAIKYTTVGHVDIKAYVEEDNIVVEVEDTGEGLRKSEIPELFNKFKRANLDNESLGVRPPGTGLGLYVSKGIIEKHNGKMWVESEFGKGSKFFFSIPIIKYI